MARAAAPSSEPCRVPVDGIMLDGDLTRPANARGLVLFAHGSGSSRLSPRNQQVAGALVRSGFATFLMDLLTGAEERVDERTGELRFDIGLLAERLQAATEWLGRDPAVSALPIGYFGASTGAAAALVAAARLPQRVRAIVSRGGRPDLAADALDAVRAPTLLIVGSRDELVVDLNRDALTRLGGDTRLEIVSNATHLFSEPGALERVAELAAAWYTTYLRPPPPRAGEGQGGGA